MNARRSWRPSSDEVLRAIDLNAGKQGTWAESRLRVLSAVQSHPKAPDIDIARLARTKTSTVRNPFMNWKQDGIAAVNRFGRPADLKEYDRRKLKELVSAGKLLNPPAVRAWVSQEVLHLAKTTEIPLARARILYREAGGRKIRVLASGLLDELKISRPVMAEALEQIVKNGLAVKATARRFNIKESTLRYYLRCGSKKKRVTHLTLEIHEALKRWCNRNRTNVRVEAVRAFLSTKGVHNKSSRSIHRYIQHWKDSKGIRRRHWSCGGSKHGGLPITPF